MKILVTGGAGFIGSHLVDRLVENGHKVYVLDNLTTGSLNNINKAVTFLELDINSKKTLNAISSIRPEIVFHLAAQVSVQASIENPVFDGKTNILGSVNLLKSCVNSGVRKTIFASSAAVYGNPQYLPVNEKHPITPLSFYGASKYASENYIQVFHHLFKLNYAILRYANVYGPRQSARGEGGVVAKFTECILNNKTPKVFGSGLQTRDFIYVEDIVSANLAALEKPGSQLVNVSTNSATSINHLLEIYGEVINKKVNACRLNARTGDVMHSRLDNQLAKTALNWQADNSLFEGISKTIQGWNR